MFIIEILFNVVFFISSFQDVIPSTEFNNSGFKDRREICFNACFWQKDNVRVNNLTKSQQNVRIIAESINPFIIAPRK